MGGAGIVKDWRLLSCFLLMSLGLYVVLTVALKIQLPSQIFHISSKTDVCKNAKQNSATPIRQFFYHALHKTGSTVTREHLRHRCNEAKISCLTYNVCYKKYKNGEGLSGLMRCFQPMEAILDTGTMTAHRYYNCCKAESLTTKKYEAVVEHFFMSNDAETRAFLEKHLPPLNQLFRFTVLRHPVDQFISYYKFAHVYRKFPRKFNYVVESLYQQAIGNLTISPGHPLWQTFQNLANYQIQELTGWNGTNVDLQRSLEILNSLDFVGIYEELHLAWKCLRLHLGWQNSSAFGSQHKGLPSPKIAARKNVSKGMAEKIATIQWADMALYNAGRQLWFHCYRPTLNTTARSETTVWSQSTSRVPIT